MPDMKTIFEWLLRFVLNNVLDYLDSETNVAVIAESPTKAGDTSGTQ
jgi:hypothetical protein